MKKLLTSVLILLCLFAMVGCAKENGDEASKGTSNSKTSVTEPSVQDIPSEKMISDDLVASLVVENAYTEITDIELVKSLKGDNTYTATFSVLASSKYADWEYEAKVEYTKYDQGWMVDTVDWNEGIYEQVRLPGVDDMVEYAGTYLLNHEVYSDVSFTEYIVPMQSPTLSFSYNTSVDDEVLEFNWKGTEHLLHANVSHDFTSLWRYDSKIDNWTLYPDDSSGSLGFYVSENAGEMTPNYDLDFSGKWSDDWRIRSHQVPLEINIPNFSWEGFDAEITWDVYDFNKDAIVRTRTAAGHFTRTDRLPDEYVLYAEQDCVFTDGNGGYITFYFQNNYTRIHYVAQGCETYIYVSIKHSLPTLQ